MFNQERAPVPADELSATLAEFGYSRMLPRAAYVDPAVFQWEQRHILSSWVCVGYSADLPHPGSQRAVAVGNGGVLLTRDDDGAVHAFANTCRHRGHELLACGETAKRHSIVCPYHSWSYKLDGSLRNAPSFRNVAHFDPSQFGLVALRIVDWHGWLFVDPSGRSGDFAEHVAGSEVVVGRYRPEDLQIVARHSYELSCNWKVIAENYQECYHCSTIHPELSRISPPTSGDNLDLPGQWMGGSMDLIPEADTMSLDGRSGGVAIAGLSDIELRTVMYLVGYPNLLVSLHPDYVMTHLMTPLAVDRTHVECAWAFPREVSERPGFDPSYAVDFWDLTNRQDWAACESVQRGLSSPHARPGPLAREEDGVYQFVTRVARAYQGSQWNAIADKLGRVGLPAPVAELAARRWDVIVVGGGHNGLTCAAYLARAGKQVLVLEARDRLGGACTLEQPFADERYVISPCAYVVGLLDDDVIRDLDLSRRGLEVYVADPQLWVPFEDGTAFGQWMSHERTIAGLQDIGVSDKEIDGYLAYEKFFDDMRIKLRKGERDTWVGDSPTRAELEEILGDRLMIDALFEASIAEVLDEFVSDQRLKDALFGQGVIGTFAGPHDPGTASVKLMHYQGDLLNEGPIWGYVRGGMGMVSFAIADAAQEAGAVLAAGVPVGEIVPGEGVRLEDGTFLAAPVVVSNADPKRVLAMVAADAMPSDYRARLEAWDIRSPVVKFNSALSRLPSWTAAPGETFMARGTVDVTTGLGDAQAAFERCAAGEPAVGFGEIYVQTLHDPSPAPPGKHLMSVFGQYAPYDLNGGGWEARRDEVAKQFIELISRFAPDFTDCLEHYEVLGAPDIEARVGLTGGHIFQGEVRPDQMWEHRLTPRTPIPGVYLCGAATHPAGSVIATNGRNAASAILSDSGA